jgi:TRAP-type C4-dicarboxylate transport system permease small subunit
MKKLRNILDNILKVLCGASFLAMVALTCWQVFTRYILQNPSSWSEELVSYLFAWMALLGASLVVGERGHMNIPILVDRMGPKMKKVFHIFAEIIACLFAAVILVYGGMQITSLAMGQMTSSLGIAIGVFYVVLPLSGVLNIIYTIINIVEIANGTIDLDAANEEEKVVIEEGQKEV